MKLSVHSLPLRPEFGEAKQLGSLECEIEWGNGPAPLHTSLLAALRAWANAAASDTSNCREAQLVNRTLARPGRSSLSFNFDRETASLFITRLFPDNVDAVQ
jgi:hypothetical protein